jgi:hypothetical protein
MYVVVTLELGRARLVSFTAIQMRRNKGGPR